MLQSKFAHTQKSFKAQKIFTDRVEPKKVFQDSIESISRKPQEIITYYGKGGIGKSRLLKELYLSIKEPKTALPQILYPVLVSLDAYDYANPVNILTTIRNGIPTDCGIFDYALALYCAKTKMTIEEIKEKKWLISSITLEAINDILSIATANAVIPMKLIGKVVNAVKDHRMKKIYKEEMEIMAGLNEFEIFERLPYYLGLCLSQIAEEGKTLVLFLDSYESLLSRTYAQTPSVGCEDWLKELFLSSKVIRIVIASRERLRWDMEDNQWNEYLNQHRLNNLSEEDSRWFLEKVPILGEGIVDFIVKNAKGVPLFLDMCVDVYESLRNESGNVTLEQFVAKGASNKAKGSNIIDRYLRHLSQKQNNAIKVLSSVHTFDRDFAMKLLQQANLPFFDEELSDLLEKSIVLSIDSETDKWKLDESIRFHVWKYLPQHTRQNLSETLVNATIDDTKGTCFPYFANAIEHIVTDATLVGQSLGAILDRIEFYANGGFWSQMHGLLKAYVESEDVSLRTMAVFSETICLRRYGRLNDAVALIEKNPSSELLLGNQVYYYRYLYVQLRHLLGDYNYALDAYKNLVEEAKLVSNVIPSHIYTQILLKYADLLFLKGHFDEAMKIVDEKLSEEGVAAVDQMELMRIKGHIFRFQKQFAKARLIYASALKVAEKWSTHAMKGKLLTNLMECDCWTAPTEALKTMDEALETNMDNDIELCKCHAAAAIAYAFLGQSDLAFLNVEKSRQKAEVSGYKAGMAFSIMARCIALKELESLPASSNTEAAKQQPWSFLEAMSELKETITKLDVYHFLIDMVKNE